jgi:hypothetical protein
MARAFAEAIIASADDLATGSPSIIPTRSFTKGDAMDMAKTSWCIFKKNSESTHAECKSTYAEVYTKSASLFQKLQPLAKEYIDLFVWDAILGRKPRGMATLETTRLEAKTDGARRCGAKPHCFGVVGEARVCQHQAIRFYYYLYDSLGDMGI